MLSAAACLLFVSSVFRLESLILVRVSVSRSRFVNIYSCCDDDDDDDDDYGKRNVIILKAKYLYDIQHTNTLVRL